MSSENIYHGFSGFAGDDNLVAHHFGKRDLDTKKIVTTGLGEAVDGLIHDDFEAGRAATLDIEGYPLRLLIGVGGCVAGTFGMSAADGTGITWTAGHQPACRFFETKAEGQLCEIELFDRRTFVPQEAPAVLVDNSAGAADDTIQAIPNPAEAPASADALRDDLVANTLPAIRNNVADLTAKVNALLAILAAHGLTE
jgi:hypothetical protein